MNSDELRTALLAGDLSRPRLTWYDDATGERIDLSGKTLLNWVAKAANWLEVEMALAPGDQLGLTIPANHWRAIYWSLAAWTRGLTLSTGADADAVVALSGAADGADLAEPSAALAASPLQAMSDAMPGPVGLVAYAELTVPKEVPTGSRVLLSEAAPDRVPALTAALIGHGCSVLVVRNTNEQTLSARSASEAVDVVL